MAAIIHGGSNSGQSEFYDTFDHIITENQAQCKKQQTLPDGGKSRSSHGILYVEPWLMTCGGYRDGVPRGTAIEIRYLQY